MKRIALYIILSLFIASPCWSAEFLVKAKPHYLEGLKNQEVKALSPAEQEAYEARSLVGDIIVVRPDGWEWGRAECLPSYIVFRVPWITYEDAKHYEEQLLEIYTDTDGLEKTRMKARRKFRVPESYMQTYIDSNQSVVDVPIEYQEWLTNIIEKVLN